MPLRGRFAPSPTGPLHFGSLIAALASFLDVRSQGGTWLVRIDDIDTPRVVPGSADDILATLERYGMTWDEPVSYQSQRIERYRTTLERLSERGFTYLCTCSRREIAQAAIAGRGGMIYPGTCRAGTRHQDRRKSIRLRTDNCTIAFHDSIQGRYSQALETEAGDFVVRRADGLFAYQLAVVVDDADQGISHVVRGSDLLGSTPRQIYLQSLLKLPTPRYSHLPLATNRHGSKLSKQTGAVALDKRNPGLIIAAALAFLNQCPPLDLGQESLATIWAWAISHWQPERIPAVTARYWPAECSSSGTLVPG